MQITLRGSAISLAPTAMDDREDVRLPALPSARELRRARLVRHLSRRQLGFLALHLAMGDHQRGAPDGDAVEFRLDRALRP